MIGAYTIMRAVPQVGTLQALGDRGRITDTGSVSLSLAPYEGDESTAAPPMFWPKTSESASTSRESKSDRAPEMPPLNKRLAALLQPPLSICLAASGPIEWPADLMDFQRTGVRMLVERPQVLLADDMGLGKTVQAAASIRLLTRRREIESTLIVAPAGVVRNWRAEMAKWAPELRSIEITGSSAQRMWKWDSRVHVKIVSYETLRSDIGRIRASRGQWDLICLDEAQRIKNSESAIGSAVNSLTSERRWALTGTPLENSVEDLRSIISFLTRNPVKDEYIRSSLAQVQLRRRKSDVLSDLPPKLTTELAIPLTRDQREEYDRMLKSGTSELRDKGTDATVTDVLALIIRLKQVCNFATESGRSSKLEDIAGRLTALREEGNKALIFSQFTSETYGVQRLGRALSKFGPVLYTGDMSMNRREEAARAFRDNPEAGVMILSLRAGGVGLNLQSASYVFHFDRWWNPASELQAEDRSHRIGQTKGVSVYKYICEDTIEERIHHILQSKKALFADYVDDVCMDLRGSLTEEELFGIFNIEPPRRPRNATADVSFSELSDPELTILVKYRLERLGYDVDTTPAMHDGRMNLIARRTDELGSEITLLVQCRNSSQAAGVEVVREMNDALPRDGRIVQGLLVCPGGFTAEARSSAAQWHIMLWEAAELAG
jgi:SNF2 family DNA or RNA helicase